METKGEYPKKAGIYKLTCIENGKIYIGKAINIYKRILYHRQCCNRLSGKFYFENALVKYGWDSFTVDVIEIFENFNKLTDNNSLIERESFYIKLYDSTNPKIGYNICEYSNDRTGHKCSDETRNKMSISKLGKKFSDSHLDNLRKPKSEEFKEKCRNRKFSEETRKRMSDSRMGKRLSKETREKMSQSRRGKKLSAEHKEKSRQAKIGTTHTEETKEKMRRAHLGKIMSEESREKMRQSKLGKPLSQETKEKMRLAHIGKPKSEETKKRMRESKAKIKS